MYLFLLLYNRVIITASIPYGIQNNIPISTLTGTKYGCSICYWRTYSQKTQSSDLNECLRKGISNAFVGAVYGSSNPIVFVGAGGDATVIATVTSLNTVNCNNGACFYNNPGYSFGFAPLNSIINQAGADINNATSNQRLSWHLDNNLGGNLNSNPNP